MVKLLLVCCVGVLMVFGMFSSVRAQERPNRPPTRGQIRKMLKDLDGLSDAERKARIQELYEKYGKPMLKRLTKAKYQSGTTDENGRAQSIVQCSCHARLLTAHIERNRRTTCQWGCSNWFSAVDRS